MNDKIQSLTSLDVFLLALIDSGVATAYAMREEAGISIGASRPALQRLKRVGLVEEGESEARNKLTFRLTRSGRRAMVSGLKRLLMESQVKPPTDHESILRTACLATVGGNKSAAGRLLSQAAGECSRRAREFDERALKTGANVAGLYRSLMGSCSGAQLQALSSVLADLATGLKKFPTKGPILRPKQRIKNRV